MKLLHLHLHGLFRSFDLELGKNLDTGGQTGYVLNLCKQLSMHDRVKEVVVVTRLIEDVNEDESYASPVEQINKKAKILRFRFGPKGYINKEKLWPYLDELVAQLIHVCSKEKFDFIHAHYADAGHVGAILSQRLGIPLIFTGHSFGQDKLRSMTSGGWGEEKIDKEFSIWRRIAAEEAALKQADFVIVSSEQEAQSQLARYCAKPKRVEVIAPGIDEQKFTPTLDFSGVDNLFKPFLSDVTKPSILSICRLDPRKNVPKLIKAFKSGGFEREYNLVLLLGQRENTSKLSSSQLVAWREVVEEIDNCSLYGKVAFPKSHQQEDVPKVYSWAASRKGIFVNPAFNEPFGLTCLESMACGLPVVATMNGGPKTILRDGEFGALIDPHSTRSIVKGMRLLLSSAETWERSSKEGIRTVREHYSWSAYTDKLLNLISTNALVREAV